MSVCLLAPLVFFLLVFLFVCVCDATLRLEPVGSTDAPG